MGTKISSFGILIPPDLILPKKEIYEQLDAFIERQSGVTKLEPRKWEKQFWKQGDHCEISVLASEDEASDITIRFDPLNIDEKFRLDIIKFAQPLLYDLEIEQKIIFSPNLLTKELIYNIKDPLLEIDPLCFLKSQEQRQTLNSVFQISLLGKYSYEKEGIYADIDTFMGRESTTTWETTGGELQFWTRENNMAIVSYRDEIINSMRFQFTFGEIDEKFMSDIVEFGLANDLKLQINQEIHIDPKNLTRELIEQNKQQVFHVEDSLAFLKSQQIIPLPKPKPWYFFFK